MLELVVAAAHRHPNRAGALELFDEVAALHF
jgi:hypothetical protein